MDDLFDHALNGPKRERLRGLGWTEDVRPARGRRDPGRYWLEPGTGRRLYEDAAFAELARLEDEAADGGPEVREPQGP